MITNGPQTITAIVFGPGSVWSAAVTAAIASGSVHVSLGPLGVSLSLPGTQSAAEVSVSVGEFT